MKGENQEEENRKKRGNKEEQAPGSLVDHTEVLAVVVHADLSRMEY